MRKRHFENWLLSFVQYASIAEAPLSIYFWVGISTIAGALQRKVWIDQRFFKWLPNFFVIIVGPPAVISKSTSTSIGMDLLRAVPEIHFGPDSITWQALVTAMAQASKTVPLAGAEEPLIMSPLTIESSELGVFLNPDDKTMMSALINLWDGKLKFEKQTKGSGLESITNPWLNLLGSTTPSWMRENFNDDLVESGLSSRIVFLYAREKRQRVPYLSRVIPPDHEIHRQKLIEDLAHMSQLVGEYKITPEAYTVGEKWYRDVLPKINDNMKGERFNAFLARKQTMAHKLAMVLAASQRDELIITGEDLTRAIALIDALEDDLPKVFAHIGQSEDARHANELISYVSACGRVEFQTLFRHMFRLCPNAAELEAIIQSAVRAGYIKTHSLGGKTWVYALKTENGEAIPDEQRIDENAG